MDANAREWSGCVIRPTTEILLLIRVYSRQMAVFHLSSYPDSGKSAASPVRLADETATFLEPGNCLLIPSAGSFTSRNCLVQNGFRAPAGGSAVLGILRA